MSNDYVYVPIEELPNDADPTAPRPSRFTFGSDVFGASGHWIIAENNTDPVRVYKVPMPVTRMLNAIFDDRYEQGRRDALRQARKALGCVD